MDVEAAAPRGVGAHDPSPYRVADLERTLAKRSARGLPAPLLDRLRALELPPATLEDALGAIWRFADWTAIWTRHGQQWYYQARREDGEGKWRQAAISRRHAAMCYLAAEMAALDDGRTGTMLRSTSARFFSQALPHLYEHAIRVGIPFRDRQAPGYLRLPAGVAHGDAPPVLIALGSASTTKEEALMLGAPFVEAGWALLTVDWPGTGELGEMRLDGRSERLVEAAIRELSRDPRIDMSRIALLGLGLGSTPVVRAAANDPRIGGVVVVSPPFDPSRWPRYEGAFSASPFHSDAQGSDLAESFTLRAVIEELKTPLLVFGGGYDQVAPPAEAERVACAAGEWATLVWYPAGGHLLWDARDDWPLVATAWLATLFANEPLVDTGGDEKVIDVGGQPASEAPDTPSPTAWSRDVAHPQEPPEWAGLGPGEVGDIADFDVEDWVNNLSWHGPAGAPPRAKDQK